MSIGRVIFINLAIDHLWDSTGHLQRLYPVRIPESERLVRACEDLGLFLSQPGDVVLGANCDEDHLELLHQRGVSFGNLIGLEANPYDHHDWLEEVADLEIARKPAEFWPCALSQLEQGALRQVPYWRLPSWLPRDLNILQLNQKTQILKWGEISGLSVPKTSMVAVTKLLADGPPPEISFPLILKSDWGSGFAGNVVLDKRDDHRWKHFQRQLRGQTLGRWLVQELVRSRSNLAVFGFANETTPQILNVSYEAQGQICIHQGILRGEGDRLMVAHQKIADHLRQLKYFGPFGFEVAMDRTSGQIFLLDVNVRWTKTHLIHQAALRLGLDWNQIQSRSLRYRGRPVDRFGQWWEDMGRELDLDSQGHHRQGHLMVPYLMGGTRGTGPGMKELSYFVTDDLEWSNQVADRVQRWAATTDPALSVG